MLPTFSRTVEFTGVETEVTVTIDEQDNDNYAVFAAVETADGFPRLGVPPATKEVDEFVLTTSAPFTGTAHLVISPRG